MCPFFALQQSLQSHLFISILCLLSAAPLECPLFCDWIRRACVFLHLSLDFTKLPFHAVTPCPHFVNLFLLPSCLHVFALYCRSSFCEIWFIIAQASYSCFKSCQWKSARKACNTAKKNLFFFFQHRQPVLSSMVHFYAHRKANKMVNHRGVIHICVYVR